MKTSDWLRSATAKLTKAGVATARLDALVLLEDQLSVDRAQILAHPELALSPADKNVLNQKIEARATHQPLAYIRQKTEFYGRIFNITTAVLEPRPESETMIDMLKILVAELQNQQAPSKLSAVSPTSAKLTARDSKVQQVIRIADVGSGSGAIGITAQLELPNCQVDLLELDNGALQVAKSNVVLHTLSISVIKSDLLLNSSKNYDILLCNLPYVPDDFHINIAASHEPRIAIFGGPDGLTLYRRLFDDMLKLQHRPLYVLIEALPTQHDKLSSIAAKNKYRLVKTDDFIQLYKNQD